MPATETANLQSKRLLLNSSNAWLELWELRLNDTDGYFVTSNYEAVTFAGVTYSPFPIGRAEIEQRKDGTITEVSVTVCNVDRVIEQQGETLAGKVVILRVVNEAHLSTSSDCYQFRFIVEGVSANEIAATLRLSTVNLIGEVFPRNRFHRTRCGWVFGSTECGYDTTRSGALTTCDHSLSGANGCTVHGDDEVSAGLPRLHPLRFDGEPSLLKGAFA